MRDRQTIRLDVLRAPHCLRRGGWGARKRQVVAMAVAGAGCTRRQSRRGEMPVRPRTRARSRIRKRRGGRHGEAVRRGRGGGL